MSYSSFIMKALTLTLPKWVNKDVFQIFSSYLKKKTLSDLSEAYTKLISDSIM